MDSPAQDDYEELILSCRYGDLEEVEAFISRFGPEHLATARDDNGNTLLHMAAANEHLDLLRSVLPRIPRSALPSFLRAQNSSGSTALHWAALNSHLETCQYIVGLDAGEGTGVELLEIRNVPASSSGESADIKDKKAEEREGGSGRSVLGVAEEVGWEEGARWMVSVMRLGEDNDQTREGGVSNGDDSEEKFEGGDVEVEIEDADGGVARMSLGPTASKPAEATALSASQTPPTQDRGL